MADTSLLASFAEKISLYASHGILQRALIVGVLVALCASLLGVTLVLKRFSFIGDGLSHVAFGAMAVAAILKLKADMVIIMPITILAAVLLLKGGKRVKIKGDAAVAMISVGALAIGYLLMNVFSTSANVSGDVCTTLFGSMSILTVKWWPDVTICAVASALVIAFYVLFYNKVFCITFDEDFSRATGIKAGLYDLLLAIIIGVIIVLAMDLVGSLLISALIIFPALSAMRVYKSFKAVTVCSAAVGVSCALIGIFLSMLISTPIGSTIVGVDIVVFAAFWAAGKIKKGA